MLMLPVPPVTHNLVEHRNAAAEDSNNINTMVERTPNA